MTAASKSGFGSGPARRSPGSDRDVGGQVGAALLLGVLRAYQSFLSPLLGSACKFYPSCSNYAYEAIERWGAARGAWLAFRRVLRCRPFAPGGCDPVPEPPSNFGATAEAGQ